MRVKMIVFPNDDDFTVLVWGNWTKGSMQVRRFDNRTAMVETLKALRLISSQEAIEIEQFDFLDSCPLYSAEVDEETLASHGFHAE